MVFQWRRQASLLLHQGAGAAMERATTKMHSVTLLREEQTRLLRRALNAHFSSSLFHSDFGERNASQDHQQQDKSLLLKDDFTVDTLPALKVLAETFELMKQSPALQKWTSADWLLGLTGTLLCNAGAMQRFVLCV